MRLRDLTGQTIGRWLVLERATSRATPNGHRRTYWRCRCTCGQVREVLALQLTSGGSLSCGCLRAETAGKLSHARRKAAVGYYPAHRRLEQERGFAKTHTCVDCSRPAAEWSYNHTDPDEVVDEQGRRYSMKPDHYSPRCCACHRAFDRETRLTHA